MVLEGCQTYCQTAPDNDKWHHKIENHFRGIDFVCLCWWLLKFWNFTSVVVPPCTFFQQQPRSQTYGRHDLVSPAVQKRTNAIHPCSLLSLSEGESFYSANFRLSYAVGGAQSDLTIKFHDMQCHNPRACIMILPKLHETKTWCYMAQVKLTFDFKD